MSMTRNRSSNPGSNRDSNRGPGRTPRMTTATESAAGLTGDPLVQQAPVAQASVLGTWAANSPDLQVEQGPWEPVAPHRPGLQDADPDGTGEELAEMDPDLAFGQEIPRRADPLPPGSRVHDGAGSDFEEPTRRGGSTASSRDGERAPNPLAARGRAAAFAKIAAAGFAALSGVLNDRLAVDEQDETWLADDEDLDAVGNPAGRLISRKLPIPEGTDTSDLADAIEIAIAAAGYVAKNTREWVRGLRERRRAHEGVAVYQEN